MTSDGDPPKPKESQGTLLGFPQQPSEPARKPPGPTKHPLPPPRGSRASEAVPPQAKPASIPPTGPRTTPGAAQPPPAPAAPSSPPPAAPAPASRPPAASGPQSGSRAIPSINPGSGSHAAIPGQSGPAPKPIASTPTVPTGAATAPHAAPSDSGAFGAQSRPGAGDSGFRAPSTAVPRRPGDSIPPPPAGAPASGATQLGVAPIKVSTEPVSAGNAIPKPDPVPEPPFGSMPELHGDPQFVTQMPQAVSHPDGGPRDWGVVSDLADGMAKVPSKFVSFLKISAKRAFRLRIEPTEVLDSERDELEAATPPIVDRNLQAFLAWRRSVLFLVACVLTPLAIIGFFDATLVGQATAIRVIKMAPVLAEFVFLGICWLMLKQWAHWRKQRAWLLRGWLLFIATPFIVFLYPVRTVFEHYFSMDDVTAMNVAGVAKAYIPLKIAIVAMLQLAPKAISMMPGLSRASLVIKLLFPGSTAPGWLIVVAAPLYALLAYVILIVPYQFTGSGWFIGGVLGIIAGQIVLARAGFALARPLTQDEAVVEITRVRKLYVSMMVGALLLIIIALGHLVVQLKLHALDVIMTILKFETNVLILTLIGSDLVLANLDKARSKTAGRDHVEDEAEAKIAAFVSLDAPHVPPPRGPAPLNNDFDAE